jgi:hypothetical protein
MRSCKVSAYQGSCSASGKWDSWKAYLTDTLGFVLHPAEIKYVQEGVNFSSKDIREARIRR